MQKRLLTALIACLVLAFTGCKDTDLTPAFIYVTADDINNCVDVSTFNADHDLNFDAEQLSALQQHNFTHVNVYVNNKNLGCWRLPCKVPVLDINSTDSSEVILLPCFRKTGMEATIQGYPFFNILKQKALLVRGETYNVSDNPPVYVYSSYAHFPFFETFANSSSFSTTDSTNQHTFYPTSVDGRTVGEIVLNEEESFDVSSIDITVPVYNYYTFLEITYKTEGDINIGLKMSTSQYPNTVYPLGGIYSSDGEWKTIYFELSSILLDYHYTGSEGSVINLILDGMADADKDQTHFYIDNIKVIYERSAS